MHWLLLPALCLLAWLRCRHVLFRVTRPGVLRRERMVWWLVSSAIVGLRAGIRGLLKPRHPRHTLSFHLFNEIARGVVRSGQRALWANPRNYSAVRNVFHSVGQWRLAALCRARRVSTETVVCTVRTPRPSLLMQTTQAADVAAPAVWVIYFHGGGYASGSPWTVADVVARLLQTIERARDTTAPVRARALVVRYALAPEHPYPAALEDAVAAYQWLMAHHSVAPSRICLAGDSGGGGLALACALRLHHLGLPAPGSIYCLSPFLDLRWKDIEYDAESIAADCIQPLLAQGCARNVLCGRSHQDYTNTERRPSAYNDLFASPVLASDEALRALPPALVQIGELEIFRREARHLARRCAQLQHDGAEALQLSEWEGMTHCFQLQAHLTPVALEALSEGAEFVLQHARLSDS